MKHPALVMLAAALLLSLTPPAYAASVWADSVSDYSTSVQNFGIRGAGNGTLMSPATEFWVLGEPDAAANPTNTGLVPDHVAGWRSDAPEQFIVVAFEHGILDVPGTDLTIRMFSGPNAQADVLGSVDGTDFKRIGSLGPGTPLGLRNESFDFANLFDDPVHSIRVERIANGRQTGMFFDAFGATEVVPLPSAVLMFAPAVALLALAARRARRA